MAKQDRLDYGSLDFDPNLDFDTGDWEPPAKSNKSKAREVTEDVVVAAGSAVKSHFTDPRNLANIAKRSLPTGYGQAWDAVDKGASTLTGLYDEAVKELKPSLSVATRKLDDLVPEDSQRLKKFTKSLREMFKSETENVVGQQQAQQDELIRQSVEGVFAAQIQAQEAQRKDDDARRMVDDKIEMDRDQRQFTLLARMDQNMQRVGEYTLTTNQAFQKKSLELQFRTYYKTAELVQAVVDWRKRSDQLQEGILKNTSLPEFVKIKESERFKQIAHERLFGSIQEKLFGKDSRIQKGLKSIGAEVRQGIAGVKQGFEAGIGGIDALQDMREQNEMMADITGKKTSGGTVAGQMLGSLAGGKLEELLGDRVRGWMEKNDKLMKGSYTAGRYAMDPGALVDALSRSDTMQNADLAGGLKGKALGGMGWILNHFRDSKVQAEGKAFATGGEVIGPAYTDERMRRAQIDVVPGYLARILREVHVLRTGDEKSALLSFDNKTGKFKAQTQMASDLKAQLSASVKKSSLGYRLGQSVKELTNKENLSPEDTEQLRKVLFDLSTERDVDFTADRIEGHAAFTKQTPEAQKLFKEKILDKMRGDDVGAHKARYDLTKNVQDIRRDTGSLYADIAGMVQEGYTAELEELGLITLDGTGKYKVNTDKYEELQRDSSADGPAVDPNKKKDKPGIFGVSDEHKKTGISGLNGKAILKQIRKLGLFNWSYKPGQGDNKQRQGPMAQNVRDVMGPEVAPNGQEIDLVSLNGKNMAAIQALADQQEEAMQTGKTVGLLEKIEENTRKLHDLMMNRPGYGGGRGSARSETTEGDEEDGPGLTQRRAGVMGWLEDGFGMLGRGARKGGRKMTQTAKQGKGAVGDLYDKHKDQLKDGALGVMKRVLSLTDQAVAMGSDIMFNKAPKAVKDLQATLAKAWGGVKGMFYDTRDLWVKGKSSPAIRAQLMRAGYYRDQATGKVIKTIGELKTLKGNLVNEAGEVVLTMEEAAEGLFDSAGKKVTAWWENARNMLGRGLRSGLNALSGGLATGMEKLQKMPGFLGNVVDKGRKFLGGIAGYGFGGPGIGGEKHYDVLVQIRDLLAIGKPAELVKAILERPIGKDKAPAEEGKTAPQGKGWFQKLNDATKKGLGGLQDKVDAFFPNRDEMVGPAPELVGPVLPGDRMNVGGGSNNILGGVMDKAGQAGKGLMNRLMNRQKKDAFVGPMPEIVGPPKPTMGNKASGLFGKAKGLLGGLGKGGLIGGAMGAASSLFSGSGNAEGQPAGENTGEQREVDATGKDKAPSLVRRMINKGKKLFSDKDGDGRRDGDWSEQLEKRQQDDSERKAANAASAQAAADRANVGMKYRSSENVIDTIMKKASGVLDFVTKGFGGLMEGALGLMSPKGVTGIFSKLLGGAGGLLKGGAKGIGGLLKGGASVARTVGTPLVKGAAALGRAPGIARALTWVGRARTAATVVGLATGGAGGAIAGTIGVGLSALGSILASPVVLGALAIGGAAYLGYKLYKHVTRDNMNEWERLRALQYGLSGGEDTKKFNHQVLNLEGYLLDGKIGYTQGQAHFLGKKIDPTAILEMFDIDPKNEEKVQAFNTWFGDRFRPFFLKHLSVLYGVDPKASLKDLDKLEPTKQLAYLGKATFMDGPYGVDASPFMGLDQVLSNKDAVESAAKDLEAKVGKAKNDKASKGKAPILGKVAKDATPLTPRESEVVKSAPKADQTKVPSAAPKTTPGEQALKEQLLNPSQGEDGREPPSQVIPDSATKGSMAKLLNSSNGPVKDGSSGMQYIKLGKSAKLEGLHPALLKNFLAMAQEYGETTGKSLTVNQAFRSKEEQAALYRQNPAKAAPPGRSLHEFGLAMDVSTPDLNTLDKMGLLRKYGFTRPVGGETWHIEPAGIQGNLDRARKDPAFAEMGIRASLMRGGAGIGSVVGSPLGRRNQQMAMELFNQSPMQIGPEKDLAQNAVPSGAMAGVVPGEEVLVPPGAAPQGRAANTDGSTRIRGSNIVAAGGSPAKNTLPSAKEMTATRHALEVTEGTRLPDAERQPSTSASSDTPAKPGIESGPTGKLDRNEAKMVIAKYAKQAGEDPAVMQTFSALESGLNPAAKAQSSSAKGGFQFVDGTWNEQMSKHAAKYNIAPDQTPMNLPSSTLLASEYVKNSRRALTSVVPNPSVSNLYLAYVMGPGGARQLLKAKPDAIAASILPAAGKSNPAIFYENGRARTVAELLKFFDNKVSKAANDFGIELGDLQGKVDQVADTPAQGSSSARSVTPSAARARAAVNTSRPSANDEPKAIPGVQAPIAPTPASTTPSGKDTKQYPWTTRQQVDTAASAAQKPDQAGRAVFEAMDGVASTIKAQTEYASKTFDVLDQRVAPALEAILGLMKNGTKGGNESAATSGGASRNAGSSVQASPSVLNLGRRA